MSRRYLSEFKPDLKMSFWNCDWIVGPNKRGRISSLVPWNIV